MNFNAESVDFSTLQKNDITELESLLLKGEELQVLPHEQLKKFTQNDISYFCVKHGFYIIPTQELINFLMEEINHDISKAMEIGAGHGAISRVMNIRAVDNFMQNAPEIKQLYDDLGQATVPYGKHVQQMDGNSAVERYSPKYVIGAYCTHKYNAKEHWRGGNAYGFNEQKIIKKVNKYIHIGNRKVHSKKPALKLDHREIEADWLLSRSIHVENNLIWIWEK